MKLIGQGTFGKVYLVIMLIRSGEAQERWFSVGFEIGIAGQEI